MPHAREPDRGDGSKAGRRVDEDSNRKNLKKTIPVGYFRFWSYIYIRSLRPSLGSDGW